MQLSEKDQPGSAVISPTVEYVVRLEARRRQEVRQARRYTGLARNRNILFVLIVLVAWLGEKEKLLPLLLVAPAFFFGTVIILRNRAAREWRRTRHVASPAPNRSSAAEA